MADADQSGSLHDTACGACRGGCEAPFPFSMAFQPIVDTTNGAIFAYEALARGPAGESAASVLSRVTDTNRYAFDQSCRVKAIEMAGRLGLAAQGAALSINFLPNAVYQADTCIRASIVAARRVGFPLDRLIFEVTEGERVQDKAHLSAIITEYKRHGFRTAIDDFGAGYAGLNLLADFQPDILKIDMDLSRRIDLSPTRRAIVQSILHVCRQLDIAVIAEGVETEAEFRVLREIGVTHIQGFLFARPGFEYLPTVAPIEERPDRGLAVGNGRH